LKSFGWLSQATTSIHLFIDNVGAYGTNTTREEYNRILKDKFNVIVLWQIINSPEMNMLNLGTWVMIQCVVAHMYRGKLVLKEALCKTVYHAFNSLEGVKLINIAKQ
jgi:hypothetical protein